MAILKDLIVNGASRFIGDAYFNTIKAGVWNGTAIDVAHGGTGLTSLSSGYLLEGNTSSLMQARKITDSITSGSSYIPTSGAVYSAISAGFAANGAMVFKGTYTAQASSSSNVVESGFSTYPESASVGWTWVVTGNNSYFGNIVVEAGDMIISNVSNPGTTISNYYVIQTNIDVTHYVTTNTAQTITGVKTFNAETTFNQLSTFNKGLISTSIGDSDTDVLFVSGNSNFNDIVNIYGLTNHGNHVIPMNNNAYDLGSSSLKWRNIYAGSVTATTFTGSLSGNATSASYARMLPTRSNGDNEVIIGNNSLSAGSSTNPEVYINYRDIIGGTTSNDSTQITKYYFCNRKGSTDGVTIQAATFKGNATTATTATTATNLSSKPSFATYASDTTKITLTAGGKTSDAYTVPYATKALQDNDGTALKGNYLRKVLVANNTTNDFNTFLNMTLTGRGDPTTGASLSHAPWSGVGPGGGYGVLTYLWSNYGILMAWGYLSNNIYIRNKHYINGSGAVWDDSWSTVALTSDNVASATKLQTARTINGTYFDGSANITTTNWGTARNISIADSDSTNTGSAVSVNGSAAVTLKLPATIKASLSGNATSATYATSSGDADTVDGYHLTSGYYYKNVNTSITNSSSVDWYIQIKTITYISTDSVIGIRAEGNNIHSECVIHILCRANKYWGWQTHYNGVAIKGIYKATDQEEQLYLKIPSYITTITVRSTDTITITKADYSSHTYQNVESEGMFSNYIMGTFVGDLNGNASSASSVAWGNVTSKPETATRWPSWSEVTNKPSTFTPSSHTHDYIAAKDNYTFTSSNLPNTFDLGISAGFVNYNSGFGSYGSVLTVRTYSGGGGTLQLYAPYSESYGGTHLKARFGDFKTNDGNSWTALKTIAWLDDIPSTISWSNVTSKPTATGNATTPVYWNGSGFTNCTAYANASVNYASSAGNSLTATRFEYITDWNSPKNGANVINLMSDTSASATDNGAPSRYTSGISIVTKYVGFQLASHGDNNESLYFRKLQDNGTWHNWYLIITAANIGSQSVNYATSAGKATNDSDGNAINSTYLKKSGGTMTGDLIISKSDAKFAAKKDNNHIVSLYYSTNRGVYDDSRGRWMIYTSTNDSDTTKEHVYIPEWGTKGSSTQPIYMLNGYPTACTASGVSSSNNLGTVNLFGNKLENIVLKSYIDNLSLYANKSTTTSSIKLVPTEWKQLCQLSATTLLSTNYGTYVVQITKGTGSSFVFIGSGVMSFGSTNSSALEEIVLHCYGGDDNRLYLGTQNGYLMGAAKVSLSATQYTITFKRII